MIRTWRFALVVILACVPGALMWTALIVWMVTHT